MLLRIDGSKHRWFQDDRWYDLIVILNEGTGHSDDPGVLAPGAWAFRAQLRDMAGWLPQELRAAQMMTMEEANRFLRERYIAEFNRRFMVKAAERGSAFRSATRRDQEGVFTIQTERLVAKANTVAIGPR